jgi:very-short-patch-repair endonuclease
MTVESARSFRRVMTDAERRLWRHLRGRQLEGYKFRRQHPCGKYVLDFFCNEAMLAIELDGSQHGDPERAKRDEQRTKWLERQGIRVVRVWNYDLLTNTEGVLEFLRSILAEKPSPQPSPAEAGEGVRKIAPK